MKDIAASTLLSFKKLKKFIDFREGERNIDV